MPCQTKTVCCMTNLASGLGRWGAYFGTWWSTQRLQERLRCFSYTFKGFKKCKIFSHSYTHGVFRTVFRSARNSYRAFDSRPSVLPPLCANFSRVHRWAETLALPSGLMDPSNRTFLKAQDVSIQIRRKFKYRDYRTMYDVICFWKGGDDRSLIMKNVQNMQNMQKSKNQRYLNQNQVSTRGPV